MRDFTVTKSQDGLHVVKASQEAYPQLKSSDLFHALKRRDIRIDGKKINKDIAVKAGNVVEIWLPDELFDASKKAPAKAPEKMYEIVAETKGLLIVNKFQGDIRLYADRRAENLKCWGHSPGLCLWAPRKV